MSPQIVAVPPPGAPPLPDFAGSTLLLPGPNGIAFVGQLAIDVLIASLQLRRVAILVSPHVAAAIGTDSYGPHDPPSPRTALEVYYGHAGPGGPPVTAVQLRSRVHRGHGLAFADTLADWAARSGFARSMLLTGLDGARRSDAQIVSSPLRFLATLTPDPSSPKPAASTDNTVALFPQIRSLGWSEMEPTDGLYTDLPVRIPPGGGTTRFILDAFEKRSLPLVVLSWFALEGDNMEVAHAFASAASAALECQPPISAWSHPASWDAIHGRAITARELF